MYVKVVMSYPLAILHIILILWLKYSGFCVSAPTYLGSAATTTIGMMFMMLVLIEMIVPQEKIHSFFL